MRVYSQVLAASVACIVLLCTSCKGEDETTTTPTMKECKDHDLGETKTVTDVAVPDQLCTTETGDLKLVYFDEQGGKEVLRDGTTLELVEESSFDGGEKRIRMARETCVADEQWLNLIFDDYRVSVEWTEHHVDINVSWWEAKLIIFKEGVPVKLSINAERNADSLVDTEFDLPNGSSLWGRIFDDGSARFYLHLYRTAQIDAIYIKSLDDLFAANSPQRKHDTLAHRCCQGSL